MTGQNNRPRGRPSKAEEAAILGNLYEVAFHHFLLHGLERGSLKAIAQEAGVSRQMIYKRFGTRQQLFEESVNARRQLTVRMADLDRLDTLDHPQEVLEEIGLKMLERLLRPHSIDIARKVYAGLHRFPTMAEAEGGLIQELYARINDYIGQCAIRFGVDIVADDIRDAGRDFRSLITGLAHPVYLGWGKAPRPADRPAMIRRIVRRFLRSYGLGDDVVSTMYKPPRASSG